MRSLMGASTAAGARIACLLRLQGLFFLKGSDEPLDTKCSVHSFRKHRRPGWSMPGSS